jgi:pimeloyl-ACP methyl ester carboxylesterase
VSKDERYDAVAETIRKGIESSTLVDFENSAHMTMWDEQESYLRTVKDFITT